MTTYIKPLIFTLFMFLGTSITAQTDVFLYPLMVCKGFPWLSDHQDINLDNGCGWWEYTSMDTLESEIAKMCDTCMYAVRDDEAIENVPRRTLNFCTVLYNTIAVNHKTGIRYRADYSCLYKFKERMVLYNEKKYHTIRVSKMQGGLDGAKRPLNMGNELLLIHHKAKEHLLCYFVLDFFKRNTDSSANPRFERMLYSIVKDSLSVLAEYVRGLERFDINDERLLKAIMTYNSMCDYERLLQHSLIFDYDYGFKNKLSELSSALFDIRDYVNLRNIGTACKSA